MNMKEIKKLEKEKSQLNIQINKIENKIDHLIQQDKDRDFLILKSGVEVWNKKYGGDFTQELKDVWKKEDATNDDRDDTDGLPY